MAHKILKSQEPPSELRPPSSASALSAARRIGGWSLPALSGMPVVLRSVFAVFQTPPRPHHGRKRAVFVFAVFLLLTGANARAQVPVEGAVTAVPIVVTSTTADYFVLYVKHELDGAEVEIPVLVKRGEAGTTTLAENIEALPPERYRVEKYQVTDPADVDGDCIDDITELNNLGAMNPANSAPAIPAVRRCRGYS